MGKLTGIIDACSWLNILQAFQDAAYINYLDKEFELCHPAIVYEEVGKNRHKNLGQEGRESMDRLYPEIAKCSKQENIDEEAKNYVSEYLHLKKERFKENGETYSAMLALNLSRFKGESVCGTALKTCFITDDLGAEELFSDFFRYNNIGQIIDSIDLITLLYLKGYIVFNDLAEYCKRLKGLYGGLFYVLKEVEDEADMNEKPIISKMIELVNGDDCNELKRFAQTPKVKLFLSKQPNLKTKLEVFIEKGDGEKIDHINRRLEFIQSKAFSRIE